MRGWLGRALSLLALWLLAQAALAQDDPPGRVGRLAALQGEVWVLEPGRGEWIAALPNRPFTGGERLHTAPGASAELRIGSTTVFLGAQTEFEALRLDDERLQFRLQRGQMALRVPSPEVAAELEVLHPEARFRPLRAGFYRIDRLAEASDATVWRGALQVEAHNLSLTLQVGQRAAFWRDGPLGDTTRQWLAPAQDEFALAVQRQDQVLAQLAPSDLVPAEMTGAEDLQRYGSWTPHPEFGAVWVPTVVAAGWAPYRQGQWVWQPPWGWTWVDAAPWGFAPFHYGRWLWWSNRWCWTPGPRVVRPVFAPALVGWVGRPPVPGAGWGGRPPPPQGWVPLGPREAYRPDYRASPRLVQRLNPYPAGQPAAFVNRSVPGAVTTWPGARPQSDEASAQPDERVIRRPPPEPGRRQDMPGRPDHPDRDAAAPRGPWPPAGPPPSPLPQTAPSRPPAPAFATQQADDMATRRHGQDLDGRPDASGRPGREQMRPRAAMPQAEAPAPPQVVPPRPPPAAMPMPAPGHTPMQVAPPAPSPQTPAPPQWAPPRPPPAAPPVRAPMPPPMPPPMQAALPAMPAAGAGPFGGGRPAQPEGRQRGGDADRPDPDARRRTPESRGNPRER